MTWSPLRRTFRDCDCQAPGYSSIDGKGADAWDDKHPAAAEFEVLPRAREHGATPATLELLTP